MLITQMHNPYKSYLNVKVTNQAFLAVKQVHILINTKLTSLAFIYDKSPDKQLYDCKLQSKQMQRKQSDAQTRNFATPLP